ncbi:MAG TPA: hypothetical protein GX525_07955, partial [Bacilli bacterium]|nr:hypothetical protein [Bacilli bacterium]
LQEVERELSRVENQRTTEVRPTDAPRSQETSRPTSETVREVREQVSREPSMNKVINEVRRQVVNNPEVNREVAKQVERALTESRHLSQIGRERVDEALRQIENQLLKNQANPESKQLLEEVRQIKDALQKDMNVARTAEQARELIKQLPPEQRQALTNAERVLTQASQLDQVSRERVNQALTKAKNELNRVQQQANVNTDKNSSQSKPSEAIRQAIQQLQAEPSLERAIEDIKNNLLKEPMLEAAKQLEQSLNQAEQLLSQGREMAARGQLLQTMMQIEQQALAVEQTANEMKSNEAQQYIDNEQFQTSVHLTSKDIAVTTITEKLAQAQVEFKNLQREITRNLDTISRLIEQYRGQAKAQVKPLLETTIKKLDNAILKSEMMLLTDMKTEKSLMQASSQLAEATKLLNKGNYQEANRIVQDVKAVVEKLIFKPSETKIKHYIANEKQLQEMQTPSQQLQHEIKKSTSAFNFEPSARHTFEMFRGLGLNRDSEIGQMLAGTKDQLSQQQQEQQKNMKAALMQLLRGEEEQSRLSSQASQALNNVTGQQLLSKSDHGNQQHMFFNLPFILEEKLENLQVFVNSRNDGHQVDWENCNLYFLIETPKLGEVGIMVQVVDRNLNVTLKNDDPSFQNRMEPLVAVCCDRIEEIGYNIGGIKFSKMTPEEQATKTSGDSQTDSVRQHPIFTEKGFDFKI